MLTGGAGGQLALGWRAQHRWAQRLAYDYLNRPESGGGGEVRS